MPTPRQKKANGARRRGVTIFQGAKVTGIDVNGRRVTGVQISEGEIAPPVVNVAGPYDGLVGAMVGLNLDVNACTTRWQSSRHQRTWCGLT